MIPIERSIGVQAGFIVDRRETGLDFELPNDTSLLNQVSETICDHLRQVVLVDENVLLEVITALEESLANAIIHGNLELPSEAKRDHASFLRLMEQRRGQSPFCSRRVVLQIRISPQHLEIRVQDEGPGFDRDRVPDPRLQVDRAAAWGNGLLLIRTFMDEVRHNERGNEITMVRRL
jgi:anti-sigma regulatory factor (Ser/Thr protein kinase)